MAKINSVIVVYRPPHVLLPYLERNVASSLTGQGCNDTLRYDYSPGSIKLGRNGLQDVCLRYDYSSGRTRSEHLSAVAFTIPIVTNHSCLFWCFRNNVHLQFQLKKANQIKVCLDEYKSYYYILYVKYSRKDVQ